MVIDLFSSTFLLIPCQDRCCPIPGDSIRELLLSEVSCPSTTVLPALPYEARTCKVEAVAAPYVKLQTELEKAGPCAKVGHPKDSNGKDPQTGMGFCFSP